MPDLHEVIDRIHYENRRGYTSRRGNVTYLDGTPLARPVSMPAAQRVLAAIIVIAAIAIGFTMVNKFVISKWQEAAATEEAIAANLSRQPSLETIPMMTGVINMSDDEIKSLFAEAGLKIFDASANDESADLVLYRVPDDVGLDEASSYYQQGISSLEAEQVSKLLTGGWSFAADRASATSMIVRYADFSTGDPQIAVQNAILKEGFDTTTTTQSGEDESGNTFVMGSFVIGDDTYTWKVSALPLKEVYSVSGLPEDACYVGVRITRS